MPFHSIITNFTGGEISTEFEGRVDIKSYYSSCRELTNFIVRPFGGVMKAPGSYYVAEIYDSDHKAVLIPFEYDADTSYILEWGLSQIKVYSTSSHTLVDTISMVGGDWTETELFELQYAQNEKTMYIVHPDRKPMKLVCAGPTSWTLSEPTFTSITFSSTDNFPSAVCFYQSRLIFAATNNNPQTIWGSVAESFEDFTVGSASTDAFEFIIAMPHPERIRWLFPRQFDILFGTNVEEWSVTSQGGIIYSGDNQKLRYTGYGSANRPAELVGGDLLFMQRARQKIRNFIFSTEGGGYNSSDLSFTASHIVRPKIKQFAVQQEPQTILWGVRDDGVLAALVYERNQQVVAWSTRETDGEYESIAKVSKDGEDEVWVIVNRTIDGNTVRYLEYFAPFEFDAQEDAHNVDCGKLYDYGTAKNITGATQAKPIVITSAAHGLSNDNHVYISGVEGMTELNDKYYTIKNVATNTFELYSEDGTFQIDGTGYTAYTGGGTATHVEKTLSGLDHLEGETVQIYADGGVQPNETVSSGAITIDYYANKIRVGLPYTAVLEPMKIEIPQSDGTAQGRLKRINKLTLRFYKTLGCKIGDTATNLTEIEFREGGAQLGVAPALYTGDKIETFPGGTTLYGDMFVVSDSPTPMTLIAMIYEVETF